MRVLLTGGTGFVGRRLVNTLMARGDECLVVSRSGADLWASDLVTVIGADPVEPGEWQRSLSGVDAVINLAGERLVDPPKRWTSARKRRLRESRILTTRNIVAGIRNADAPPATLLSGSAIGYYGPRGDTVVDESAEPGCDFLATLACDWEQAALEGQDDTTVSLLRTGIVLGMGGGALEPLMLPFKLGLGGPWGNGSQWWSWIHLDDEIGLILFILDRKLAGAFNLTAPNPVTVNEFAAGLGKALKRPAWIRTPAFALRAGLGEASSALLELQRVVPARALDIGYEFLHPTLHEALQDLF